MGNLSNAQHWAVMERLRFIERSAYWRGVVNRQDLAAGFGLSMAQASSDLQKYVEMNPGALVYNLRRKRYEGGERMVMVLGEPRLEEAMRLFLPGGWGRLPVVGMGGGEGREEVVAVLRLPERRCEPVIERRLFLALHNGWRLRVRYASVSSGSDGWRWLQPMRFVHNGDRWHVRAWCELREDWRDFTMSRFVESEWPEQRPAPPRTDAAWDTWVTLRLRAHRGQGEASRRAVELDYGMTNGVLEIKVRQAQANYLRARLQVPLMDGTAPLPQLELVE
jgi:hypothetical protein